MKIYRCRIGGHSFNSIPVGSIRIPQIGRSTYKLWEFPDGSMHDLRAVSVPDLSPPEPTQAPVEEIQPVSVEEVVPEISPVEEEVPPTVDESEEVSMTTMEYAFRIRK
jgi:hypothetical protein